MGGHTGEEGVKVIAVFGPAPRVLLNVAARRMELLFVADDVLPEAALPDWTNIEIPEAVGTARDHSFIRAHDRA